MIDSLILSVFIQGKEKGVGRGESTSFRVVVRNRFYKCKVPVYQELNKETSCSYSGRAKMEEELR